MKKCQSPHSWGRPQETGRSKRVYGMDMDPVGHRREYRQRCKVCAATRRFWKREITGS